MNTPNAPSRLKVGIPLYPTFDSLDVLGPYQVFTYASNPEIHLVAADKSAVSSKLYQLEQYAKLCPVQRVMRPHMEAVL